MVFTSGGTEADNLAVKGLYWSRRAADPRATPDPAPAPSSTTPSSTRCTGLPSTRTPTSSCCPSTTWAASTPTHSRASIARDPATVALVSVMWANNEVGTIQPIAEVVALAAEHGIPVHSDAVQALGAVPVDFAASGVDAMTISGHKVGGPLGVGALVVRREIELTALVHGGGQERDVRCGTLDVPAVAGFAAAVEVAVKEQADNAARLTTLRDRLVDAVRRAVPDAVLNGDRTTGCPATCTSASPAARATRC